MADLSCRGDNNVMPLLTVSASFKGKGRSSSSSSVTVLKQRPSMKPCLEMDELINLLHGSNLVKVELNCLEYEDKHRELGEAQAEIIALRLSKRAREKVADEENSFDCGLFMLHYVELFLEEAPVNFCPFKISEFSTFEADIQSSGRCLLKCSSNRL